MQKEIKYFGSPQDGGVNADDLAEFIPPNQLINAENVRWGSTDAGATGGVEAIGSTVLLSTAQPSVTFVQIGATSDDENGRFCYFLCDLYGPWHKIMCWSETDLTLYTVLLSSQVTGGLNFTKNSLIHSARIVDNMLYWCEGENNQPRKINIESGIKLNHPTFSTDATAYVSPLNFSDITIIKKPPTFALNFDKFYDAGLENNRIANESFMFAGMYGYYDNETSVVGPYSVATRLNKDADTFNRVVVYMDVAEVIPQTVRFVHMVVRNSNTNFANIVKTWDREVQADADDITNHNNGVVQLRFVFDNKITGEAIAEEKVLKPFDRVPVYSHTLEAARNRIFLGNNVMGYDTPETTSLSVGFNTTNLAAATSEIKNLIDVRERIGVPGPNNDYIYAGWYVYMTIGGVTGYYLVNGTEVQNPPLTPLFSPPHTPPGFSTTTSAGLTFKGATLTDLFAAILAAAPVGSTNDGQGTAVSSTTMTITGVSSATYDVFKSRSSYKIGIQFYDFARRRVGGVVTKDTAIATIPTRTYTYTNAVNGIVGTLSNAAALTEIPDAAYYYAFVRTLNLKTRFFIDTFDKTAKYATRDTAGKYVFSSVLFAPGVVGIGINTTALVKAGLGYVFTEGDVAVVIDESNNVYEIPVIGQDGNYIILKAQDLSNLTSKKLIIEIYTPYKTSVQEPYFEMGEIYAVSDPGTSARRYSVTSHVFLPDSYAISRNFNTDTYFGEAMCPNDLFYKRWDNDGGMPCFVTKLGRAYLRNFFVCSNTYIPQTSINGLSSFDPLDEFSVPEDCGAIQRLVLTSKAQSEGTVMLSVCSTETVSIYLGESQIVDASGETQFFAQSKGIVGSINTLRGSYGTMNPESVVMFRGAVYWFDARNGKIIQYASNGLFPISDYEFTRFWKQFSKQYLSMSVAQIEALGGRPFIFGGVDPAHDELLFSIPKLLSAPPKGYLPDYPSTVNPFDCWDGMGKTMVFKLADNPNRWGGSRDYNFEGCISLNNKLFSWKYGNLYRNNDTATFNNFYGTQYKSRLMFASNMLPKNVKVYGSISIEGNLIPTLTYFRSETPYEQASDLVDFDWTTKEGVYYATMFRNKLVPTATGFTTDGLLTAEAMRTDVLRVMLEFTVTTRQLELRFVNIGFEVSRGHTT